MEISRVMREIKEDDIGPSDVHNPHFRQESVETSILQSFLW